MKYRNALGKQNEQRNPFTVNPPLRLFLLLTILGVILYLSLCGIYEYRTSEHEYQIAKRIETEDGEIWYRDQSVGTGGLKPVYVVLKHDQLSEWTNGLLGTRIQAAYFEPNATPECAEILRGSNSLEAVMFDGPHEGSDSPPLSVVDVFHGHNLQQVVFARYSFTKANLSQISESLTASSVEFVLCQFPSDAILSLNKIHGLKKLRFVKCGIEDTSQGIKDAIEALQNSGLEVTYEF
jgi:hypothetical protein